MNRLREWAELLRSVLQDCPIDDAEIVVSDHDRIMVVDMAAFEESGCDEYAEDVPGVYAIVSANSVWTTPTGVWNEEEEA